MILNKFTQIPKKEGVQPLYFGSNEILDRGLGGVAGVEQRRYAWQCSHVLQGNDSQFECLVLNGIGVVSIKLKVWDRLP